MEGHAAATIPHVHLTTEIDQKLLSLKSRVGGRAGLVNGVMEKVATVLVDQVHVCTQAMKASDLCIVSAKQCNLEHVDSRLAHLVDVGSFLS